ncbi:MAG: TIGR00730 family Rossman fold protein [Rhizobiales bacterium]|nr:TIGR00730 family Rossman fold protein [Hyphomicrobiales bacterium]
MFGHSQETETSPVVEEIFYPAQQRIKTVCVFGGARPGRDASLVAAADMLGELIAAAGIRLVYGGGCDGLMGAVATGAARGGAHVIAITPRFLLETMSMPDGCQTIMVPDMSIRKQLMFDHADAFIALPGGIGTIEELSEVLTHRKLARHAKPIVLASFGGFWTPWLAMLDHLAEQEFMSADISLAQLVTDCPRQVLPMLQRGASFRTRDYMPAA